MEILTAILALIADVAPATSSVVTITKIISSLTALIPTLVQEGKDLVPVVKNTIAALRGNPATTTEQLDQLDALDAQLDAAFDAALKAAEAEDAAAADQKPV